VKTPLWDRVSGTLLVALVVLVVAELLFVPHYKPVFPWHHVAGYAATIGLVSCIVVVLLSKALGAVLLQRPESDD
jgi:hypothetical protein